MHRNAATRAFETIYGLSREEALSGDNHRSWVDLILPEDREHAEQAIGRVRAGEQVAFDYRIRRPSDGAIRWLRNTDFPITNAAGRVVMIGGMGHDATELREAELRLETLVQGIPQLVWRAADGGHWAWASPQWEDYTGLSTDDSIGRGWMEALHPDDGPRALEAWDHAAEGGFGIEYRVRRAADHDYRWFQTRATPVRDNAGAIVEWLGTSTDIHGLRQLQERQRILVAELQHRTRNLMGVVRAMALYELATNSVKYGALGQRDARLAISWRMLPPDRRGRPRLQVEWRESGVKMPAAGAVPQGGGQGRELIERALPCQLEAETSFELGSDGVHCTITIPVSASNLAEPAYG